MVVDALAFAVAYSIDRSTTLKRPEPLQDLCLLGG
jgi:hypothetical protein